MFYYILIQYSQATGRYHPAYYELRPFPGGNISITRYKSKGHHTAGFATLPEARNSAAKLADELGVKVPDGGFEVREMVEVGVDVMIVDIERA